MLSFSENSRKQEIIHHASTFLNLQSVTVVTVVTVFSAYPHLPLFRGNLLYIYYIYNKLNIIITI